MQKSRRVFRAALRSLTSMILMKLGLSPLNGDYLPSRQTRPDIPLRNSTGRKAQAMKFTRYGKFNGLDVWSINLGDLMEGLSDSLLNSGYDDDYYWTRQQMPQDTSLDALRRALLQALMDQRLLSQHQIQQMLDENEGKYQGSQLQEMLNQLIERLIEEGYLTLREEQSEQRRDLI